MNGRKAKGLRRIAYRGDISLKVKRQYVKSHDGGIVNSPRTPRALYQALKKHFIAEGRAGLHR